MPQGQKAARLHRFGGDWTDQKLSVLADYLRRYNMALKDQPFRRAYIDAFAGTGYRHLKHRVKRGNNQTLLIFPELAYTDAQAFRDGSARLALQTTPPFDRYIFVERNMESCAQLADLKSEFPALADRIDVQRGDANEKIQELCQKNWHARGHACRAVLFLDPYGMQVKWNTVKAIAATEAIDLWLLFPLGIGVNRLVTNSGDIPVGWQRCLTELLGTDEWRKDFYRTRIAETLFGPLELREKVDVESIGRYFNNRLQSVFAGVADDPLVLRNSTGCPLYLLCFAAGNPKGAGPALRIASHLLKKAA